MRLAMISFHTSPLAPLGKGKAGGMNAYVLAMGREFAGRGIEVDCFTRIQDPDTATAVQDGPGMRVISLAAGPAVPLPPPALISYLPEFRAGAAAFQEREGRAYDLLHAHYYLSGWAGLRLKQSWRIPLLFMFHTIGPLKDAVAREGEDREPLFRRQIEEEVSNGADLIIASNPHERDSIRGLYRVAEEKVAVLPCGVDTTLFRPSDQREARTRLGLPPGKILLFVGRMEAVKGIDLLWQAMARLRSAADLPSGFFPKLILIGGEGSGDRWRAQATQLGLDPFVLFLGAQPHREMPLYYAACDALVMPSRYESFGIVALEAAACGRPVIATSVGGLPYAVSEDRTALLVPGNDVEALASAIQRILSDEGLANSLGQEGRRWAETFSWSNISDRMLSIYERALAMPATGGKGADAESG